MKPRRCDPALWLNINWHRTSKESSFFRSIADFVSISIPKNTTPRHAVEGIASECGIPIESLPPILDHPIFSRGRVIFGFVGDELDAVADEYGLEWWFSDKGLNMAISQPELLPADVLGANKGDEGRKKVGRPSSLVRIKGDIIKRTRANVSQQRFAEKCGISRETLQTAEAGLATQTTIDKICAGSRAIGVKLKPEDLSSFH